MDLLKDYWQIPSTVIAKQISAFVMPHGLFQYPVMPFGMKDAPATFQQMINQLKGRIEGCKAYIDDVVVYSDNWKDHLSCLRNKMAEFADANLN